MGVFRGLVAGLVLCVLLLVALPVAAQESTPAAPSWWSALVDFVEMVIEVILGPEEPAAESQSQSGGGGGGEGGAELDPGG